VSPIILNEHRDPRRCLAGLGIFVFTGEEKSSHRGHRGKNTEDTEKEMKEERKEERIKITQRRGER
jgi:hypothetical protein